jgi:hypothetical protein
MFRIEIVKWVVEGLWPISIVDDPGFHMLMKTGRPHYWIPSAATVLQDIQEIYKCTKEKVRVTLQVKFN